MENKINDNLVIGTNTGGNITTGNSSTRVGYNYNYERHDDLNSIVNAIHVLTMLNMSGATILDADVLKEKITKLVNKI